MVTRGKEKNPIMIIINAIQLSNVGHARALEGERNAKRKGERKPARKGERKGERRASARGTIRQPLVLEQPPNVHNICICV